MIRRTLFGSALIQPALGGLGLLVLRIFAGLTLFLVHGKMKIPPSEGFIAGVVAMGFPAPIVFAWAASLAEFLGGLCLALGLFTRLASFFVAFTMSTAVFIHHAPDPFEKKELACLYLCIALTFLFLGGGRVSLDSLLRGKGK